MVNPDASCGRKAFMHIFVPLQIFGSFANLITGAIFLANNETTISACQVASATAFMMYLSVATFGFIRLYGNSYRRHPLIFGVMAMAAAIGTYSLATKDDITTEDIVGIAFLALQLACVICYDEVYAPTQSGGTDGVASLAVGKELNGTFKNLEGETTTLAAIQGPLLVLFYRGLWCPFCTGQFKEIKKDFAHLEAAGVTVCAIGGDGNLKDTQAAAKALKVPITFLADEGRAEIRRLGLNHDAAVPNILQFQFDAESSYPALVLLDASHKVVWRQVSEDFRDRPLPSVYRAAIQQHLGVTLDGTPQKKTAAWTQAAAPLAEDGSDGAASVTSRQSTSSESKASPESVL